MGLEQSNNSRSTVRGSEISKVCKAGPEEGRPRSPRAHLYVQFLDERRAEGVVHFAQQRAEPRQPKRRWKGGRLEARSAKPYIPGLLLESS